MCWKGIEHGKANENKSQAFYLTVNKTKLYIYAAVNKINNEK